MPLSCPCVKVFVNQLTQKVKEKVCDAFSTLFYCDRKNYVVNVFRLAASRLKQLPLLLVVASMIGPEAFLWNMREGQECDYVT